MGRFDIRTRTGLISPIIQGTMGAYYDADALAFFARVSAAGGSLTLTEQNAIDALVISLKANSLWTSMSAIYPMVGASAAACAQNLKSSSFTGTFSGGWTYASTGVTPNGTNAYMNTGLKPSVSLALNSTHLSSYIRTAPTGILMGVDVTYRCWISPNQAGSKFIALNVGDTITSTTGSSETGLWLGTRISSSTSKLFRNNVINYTNTDASVALETNDIYLGCRNAAPAINFSTSQIAFSSIGLGLSDTDVTNLYTNVLTFQTSLSRQV